MSLKIFIINSVIFVIVILAAIVLCNNDSDSKYSIYLAFALIISFGLSIAGVIVGIQSKSKSNKDKKKNKIGIFGNLLYCLIVLYFMISTLMTIN